MSNTDFNVINPKDGKKVHLCSICLLNLIEINQNGQHVVIVRPATINSTKLVSNSSRNGFYSDNKFIKAMHNAGVIVLLIGMGILFLLYFNKC